MRRKDESKKPIIVNYINDFFYEHDKVPTVREIVNGTGIPLSPVHRYLLDMQEKGELSYNGYRSARTKEMREQLRVIFGLMNSTPFVRQYGILLTNGVLFPALALFFQMLYSDGEERKGGLSHETLRDRRRRADRPAGGAPAIPARG